MSLHIWVWCAVIGHGVGQVWDLGDCCGKRFVEGRSLVGVIQRAGGPEGRESGAIAEMDEAWVWLKIPCPTSSHQCWKAHDSKCDYRRWWPIDSTSAHAILHVGVGLTSVGDVSAVFAALILSTRYKVSCYSLTFLSAPTSHKETKHAISTRRLAICFIILEADMNILFIMQVKILVLIKWSCRSPNHVDHWA
jgi:hypothetical protein